MTGAEIIRRCLEDEGVRSIFGIPGDENGFLHELIGSGVRFCVNRHEQASAIMADCYGRLTGRAGVCYSTYGPGVLNLVCGLGNALLDRSPVVAFVAELPSCDAHRYGHQNIDIQHLIQPVTKEVFLPRAEELEHCVHTAFRHAEQELRGPVAIIVKDEVLGSLHPERKAVEQNGERNGMRPGSELDTIAQAKRALLQASNPIAVVGNLPIRMRATSGLLEMLNKRNLPTFVTLMGKGAIPECSKLFCGVLPRRLSSQFIGILESSDVLFHIGFDLVEGIRPEYWKRGIPKTLIHVGCSSMHVEGLYEPDIQLIGDLDSIFGYLGREEGLISMNPSMLNRNRFPLYDEGVASNPALVKICLAIAELQDKVENPLFFCDVGLHKYYMAQYCRAVSIGCFHFTNGLSTMGFSVPAAITAQMLFPERTVLSISGDGGFLINVQELELVCRNELRVIFVVFADGAYGLIRMRQLQRFGKDYGTGFSNPDFKLLARAFGMWSYDVGSADEMRRALDELVQKKRAGLIVVHTNYD